MPTAFTVSMLAWGMLAFPNGYTKAGQIGPGLGNVRWGSDYLLKTFRPDTTTNKGNLIVYQVNTCLLIVMQPAADWYSNTSLVTNACCCNLLNPFLYIRNYWLI